MKNATRIVTATFGVFAGLAGLEHGIGEILQGNVRPDSVMIQSWPDSPFFRIVSGEPAMTIVRNLLVSGVLTVLVSLVFLVWVVGFVHRRYGGLVLIGISAVWLLVGGGFAPPLLGAILGLAASRMRSQHSWAVLRPRLRQALGTAWPWALGGGLAAWLLCMPGMQLLAYALDVESATLVAVAFFSAMSLLALSIFAGFARDARSPLVPSATSH